MTNQLVDPRPEMLGREQRDLKELPDSSWQVYLEGGEGAVPLSQDQTTWLKILIGEEDQAIDSFQDLPMARRLRIIEDIGEVYSGLKVNGLNAGNRELRIGELAALFQGQTYQEVGENTGNHRSNAYKRLKAMANALNKKVDREGLLGLVTGELTAASLIDENPGIPEENDSSAKEEIQSTGNDLTILQKGWYKKLFDEDFVDIEFLSRLNERQKDQLVSLINYRLEDCFWHEDPLKVDRRQREVDLIIKGETAQEIAEKVDLDLKVLTGEIYESVTKLHDSSSPDDLTDLLTGLREL